MKNRKFIGYILLGAMLGTSMTLTAQPLIEKIQATKNSNVVYTLDGEQIMQGESAIVYGDHIYIPIRAVSENLGFDVNYSNNTVALSTSNTDKDTFEIKAESVTKVGQVIEVADKQVTILPEGQEDSYTNYVVLNVSDKTLITLADGSQGNIESLQVGDQVEVTHSQAMTFSLPPQTATYSIAVIEQNEVLENVTVEKAEIVDVSDNAFTIKRDGQELIVHVDENTYFHHNLNKRIYTIKDLEVGGFVTVVHSPVMTLSLPAQVYGIEVTVFDLVQ